jgi:hypothetical protein
MSVSRAVWITSRPFQAYALSNEKLSRAAAPMTKEGMDYEPYR